MSKSNKKDKKVKPQEPKFSKKELKEQAKALKKSAKKSDKKEQPVKKDKQSNKVDSKSSGVVNIFTAIGLEPKHRAVPFQLVRHYDEVTVARNKEQFPYVAEVQLDSTFVAVLQHKGATSFWSRTGNKYQHLEVLGKAFKVEQEGFYLCELFVAKDVMSSDKFTTLYSPFRKNALTAPQKAIVDDKSCLVVNDYMTVEEFTTGKSEAPYSKRKKMIKKHCKKLGKGKRARFFTPVSETCENEKELRSFATKVIDEGNKGINIRGEDNPYVCGHQNFHYMQITEGVNYNLTCVGFEEGAGKNEGKVTNLLFAYKDNTEIKAALGRDYSDEDSENMLKVLKSDGKSKKKKAKKGKKVKTASSPLGYVWEIHALEENTKGVLKSPTVGKFTKSKPDF